MSPRSFFWLAVHLVGRLLATLFGRRRGLARFEAGYVLQDGLPPVDPELRSLGREAGRCIGCGACDAHLPAPPARVMSASATLRCATRSLHRLEQARASLAWLAEQPLEVAERVCPRRIAIGATVEGLLRAAEGIERLRGSAQGGTS